MNIPNEKDSPAMRRILALLARKSDMSASDMSREAFVGITTLACGGYLKALRARRLVHVSGWRKTRKGFVTPLFSLGDRSDIPRPKFEDEDRDSTGMNLILSALQKLGRLTYLEAAEASGLSPNTIKNARYNGYSGQAEPDSYRRLATQSRRSDDRDLRGRTRGIGREA